MTRTVDQIVAEFDALDGVGEGHFIDEMETEELKALINRIKMLEAVCKRDRFADGYAAGAEDFRRIGGQRIAALEAALREIMRVIEYEEWDIAPRQAFRIALTALAPE